MGREEGIKRDILYPLRRLYWWIFDIRVAWHEQQRRFRLWKYLKFPRGRKVYLIGTPNHENLGDSAITLAQLQFLEAHGWEKDRIKEVTFYDYYRDWKLVNKWIPQGSLLAHLGGGHMGNQWMDEEKLHRGLVKLFPRCPSVVFPQTVYYTPDEQGKKEAEISASIYRGREDLLMVAREKVSYDLMQRLFPGTRVLLTPDIVLSADMQTFGAEPQTRKGVLLCLRSDPEKAMTDEAHRQLEALLEKNSLSYGYTDMYSPDKVTPKTRKDEVRKKMEELASAELVITDRLHGMVFCALTGTPCIVFSNYNHKVRGTYEWLRNLHYIRYVTEMTQVEAHLRELLALGPGHYDPELLRPQYDQLAEVVRKYADN